MVTASALSREEGPDGQRVCYVMEMATDVTHLHTLEREKLEAEPLGAVGQTVAGLAHGIKNTLMGLEGDTYPMESGLHKQHELRRNPEWSKIPVLFVTGHAREDAVRKDLDAAAFLADSTLSGPSTYLEKPVTAQTFVKAVANLLSVDLEETGETRQPADDVLRQQLLDLLKGADPETLQKALKVLQEGKTE